MNPPWELIEAHLDNELDAADEARLCDWLRADPRHVQVFVREVHLHQCLRAEMQVLSRQDQAAALINTSLQRGVNESGEIASGLNPASSLRRLQPIWNRPTILALAASIVLLFGLSIWFLGPTMGQPVLAEVKGADFSIQRDRKSVV